MTIFFSEPGLIDMSEGWYSQLYLLVEWESEPCLAVNVLQAGHLIGAWWTASWGLAPGEAPTRIFVVPGPVFHLNKFTQNLKCCIPFPLLVPVSMGHHLKISLPFLHLSLCSFKGFQELIRYSGVGAVWLWGSFAWGAVLHEALDSLLSWKETTTVISDSGGAWNCRRKSQLYSFCSQR